MVRLLEEGGQEERALLRRHRDSCLTSRRLNHLGASDSSGVDNQSTRSAVLTEGDRESERDPGIGGNGQVAGQDRQAQGRGGYKGLRLGRGEANRPGQGQAEGEGISDEGIGSVGQTAMISDHEGVSDEITWSRPRDISGLG